MTEIANEVTGADNIAALMTNLRNAAELRERVHAFEREQLKKPQIPIEVTHYFAPGLVAREVRIPAGAEVTGAIHKFANLNTLSQGEMLLVTESGGVHIKAPYTVVSPPGTKRAAKAITDCVWTTYLATSLTDIDQIAQAFTTNSEQDYLAHVAAHQLEGA